MFFWVVWYSGGRLRTGTLEIVSILAVHEAWLKKIEEPNSSMVTQEKKKNGGHESTAKWKGEMGAVGGGCSHSWNKYYGLCRVLGKNKEGELRGKDPSGGGEDGDEFEG